MQWDLDLLLLLWKIPWIPEHLTKATASLLLPPSSSNSTPWQSPGHPHCGIWPPPAWGQLITSIWRYRLLNLSLLAKDLLFLLNFHRSLQRNSRSQRLRLGRSAFPARAGFAVEQGAKGKGFSRVQLGVELVPAQWKQQDPSWLARFAGLVLCFTPFQFRCPI